MTKSVADKRLLRKMKRTQKKKLRMMKEQEEKKSTTLKKVLPSDETERLIQLHHEGSKQPAVVNGSQPKKKKALPSVKTKQLKQLPHKGSKQPAVVNGSQPKKKVVPSDKTKKLKRVHNKGNKRPAVDNDSQPKKKKKKMVSDQSGGSNTSGQKVLSNTAKRKLKRTLKRRKNLYPAGKAPITENNATTAPTKDGTTVEAADTAAIEAADATTAVAADATTAVAADATTAVAADATTTGADEAPTANTTTAETQAEKKVQDEGEETGYESEEAKNDASTIGYEAAANQTFESLKGSISEETMRAVEKMGFTEMTEIQAKSIPKLLEGRDLRGTAKTGAGKTLAFVIPTVELIYKLKFKPRNGTGAIIISPTRELSMQTFGVLREVMQEHTQTYGLVMGGADRKSEAAKLTKGVNIVVATPGRLYDHLQNTPHFVYKNLVCLVIDEADRIFDVGFEEEMKQILKMLPKRRQTMLFSATKDNKTNNLAKLALKTEPMEVDVDSDKLSATVSGLQQAYLVCPAEKRFLVLYTFIKKNRKKKVMVFFNSCMTVKFYHELLNYIDMPVMCIHGKQKQLKRTSTFYSFCNAESGVLLCTDVAARGWDIPAVDWIVQYDPPDDPKEYIHRVGRTARAGGSGHALLFIRKEEISFVRYLKAHKVNVEAMEITWSKVANIQLQLEKLMTQNYFLHSSGKEAFKGYIRAYNSHQLKDFFDISTLDLTKVGKCFGFQVPPFVDLNVGTGKRPVKRGGGGGYGGNKKQIAKTKIFRQKKE